MSHTAHQLYVHITWCTQDRLHLIDDEIKRGLRQVINEVSTELGYQIIAFEAVEEHVHLVVRFKPTHTLSEFLKAVKGRSSRRISLKSNKPIQWQRGYSITTVGPKSLQIAINYTKDQKYHHSDEL